jgi:hypothetical protein
MAPILPNPRKSSPSGVTRRVQAYRGEVTDSGEIQSALTTFDGQIRTLALRRLFNFSFCLFVQRQSK